jgi:hypothetical protein
VDGIVNLLHGTLVGRLLLLLQLLLLRCGLGVGVGSVVEQLLLAGNVADNGSGLFAPARVRGGVVHLVRGGGGAPDRGERHWGGGPAGSLLQYPAHFHVVQLRQGVNL